MLNELTIGADTGRLKFPVGIGKSEMVVLVIVIGVVGVRLE